MAAEQPKKPLTAYFIYLGDQRSAIVEKLGEEAKQRGIVAKTASEQWNALSAEAKEPYVEKATAAKAEYDKAMEEFKASGGEIAKRKTAKAKGAKDDKAAKVKKDKEAPKRPAGGAFGQYLSTNRKEIVESLPEGSNATTDVSKAASARWKALTDEEKKPYEEKYTKAAEEYKAAMQAYEASKPVEEHEEAKSPPSKRTKQDKGEGSEKTPAAKRAKKEDKVATPTEKTTAPARRGPKGGSKPKEQEAPEIDPAVMAEARQLGFESQLCNLATRGEVKALGRPDKDLLAALKASNGLVNSAKHTLLGGA